jgi:hypothetical protein
MSKADEYRRRAEECERIAGIAPLERARDEYYVMAEQYRQMADRIEAKPASPVDRDSISK